MINFGNPINAPAIFQNGIAVTGAASFIEASGSLYAQMVAISGALILFTREDSFDGGSF